jgi:hypothetical protein
MLGFSVETIDRLEAGCNRVNSQNTAIPLGYYAVHMLHRPVSIDDWVNTRGFL